MNIGRRDVIRGAITAISLGFLRMDANVAHDFKRPIYKSFRLKYPPGMTFSSVEKLKIQFWNLAHLNEIENKFTTQNKIIFNKHFQLQGEEVSIIGFCSEESYIEWEQSISALQVCNDQVMFNLGFSFKTQDLI